jgi:hypothetical protein
MMIDALSVRRVLRQIADRLLIVGLLVFIAGWVAICLWCLHSLTGLTAATAPVPAGTAAETQVTEDAPFARFVDENAELSRTTRR